MLYGFYHLKYGNPVVSFFSFLSAVFCTRTIVINLKGRLDALTLLAFFFTQTIALGITSYYFGERGLILVFPLTAGAFYFLEFRLASSISSIAILVTIVSSLNVLSVDMALRFTVALALSIAFCACFSSVAVRQYRVSRHESLNDFLTQIPNRRGFLAWLEKELELCKSNNNPLVLFFIDLDKFKQVNDEFGHKVGDKLLQAFAMRLLNIIRADDVIQQNNRIFNLGRLSGDEFAFATPNIKSSQEADQLKIRIIHAMSRPYTIDNHKIDIALSLGYCFAADAHWDMDELIDRADREMYQNKTEGRLEVGVKS